MGKGESMPSKRLRFPFFMFFPPIGKKAAASFVICTVGCSECSRMLHGIHIRGNLLYNGEAERMKSFKMLKEAELE